MKQQIKATHWVIEYGSDCDGVPSRGKVCQFHNEDAAISYADHCAEWSDGMGYTIITSLDVLREYCEDHMKEWTNYIYIEQES